MNNEIWRDVVADLAAIVRVQNGNFYADINELLDRAKAVLATQPPQDERGHELTPEEQGYVPLSDDCKSVFIDGFGLVPLAYPSAASAPAQPSATPQPVAAEVVTEDVLAAAVREWFPDRTNQADYFAAAMFGHPKNAHQEHIAALSGTGSDESKKGEA